MTFYEKELKRINKIVYSNQEQINTVVGIRKHIENNYDANLNLDPCLSVKPEDHLYNFKKSNFQEAT